MADRRDPKIKRAYDRMCSWRRTLSGKKRDDAIRWYHDFSKLGLETPQRPGIYGPNQRCKEWMIVSYLLMAMEYVRRESGRSPTVLELFCADGYYSHVAAHWGASRVKGIDKDPTEISFAQEASKRLLHDSICEFEIGDVFEKIRGGFDILLCAGGLYHLSDPKALLIKIREMAPKYLICQSVVTLATDEERYFESPAPGWTWGCRFTSAGLKRMLRDSGFEILHAYENELFGNERREDRGSAYALCRPKQVLPG